MADLFALLALGPEGWGDEILAGAWLTLRLALATLPFGLALGLAVALAKNARSPILRAVGNVFTTVFRGLPELLTILIIYFGLQITLQKIVPGFEISAFLAGMIALGVVLAAFSSEVWLGALRGIGKGQSEGAFALGLSRSKTFRLVVFPQLLRLALPGLGNNWLVLLKDTSLISVIALNDLMRQTSVIVGVTKEPFFFYLIACLLYLAMSLVSTWILATLEARAGRGFARVGAR